MTWLDQYTADRQRLIDAHAYEPSSEKDACGVGFLASLKGESSHWVLQQALRGLDCMEHRGGCGGDGQEAVALPLVEQLAQVAGSELGVALGFPQGCGVQGCSCQFAGGGRHQLQQPHRADR